MERVRRGRGGCEGDGGMGSPRAHVQGRGVGLLLIIRVEQDRGGGRVVVLGQSMDGCEPTAGAQRGDGATATGGAACGATVARIFLVFVYLRAVE